MTGPFRTDPEPIPKPKKKTPTMDAIGRVIRAYCEKFERDFWNTLLGTFLTAILAFVSGIVGWILLAFVLDWTNVRPIPDKPVQVRHQGACAEKIEKTDMKAVCAPGAKAIPFTVSETSYVRCECPPVSTAPAKEVAAPSASSASSAPLPLP